MTCQIRLGQADGTPLSAELKSASPIRHAYASSAAHAALMAEREGEVLRTDVVCRVEGGRLTVTLLAESREQIGRTVERPGETGRIPGTNAEPSAN